MPDLGQELTDPDTGARLRFRRTSKSSEGESTVVTLDVLEGWSAGPLHVHPLQSERMLVVDGVFNLRRANEERELRVGDRIDVAPGTVHTIRRPPGFVPAALRAWVESRGFGDEIRYLWPRRVGGLFGVAAVLTLIRELLRRRHGDAMWTK